MGIAITGVSRESDPQWWTSLAGAVGFLTRRCQYYGRLLLARYGLIARRTFDHELELLYVDVGPLVEQVTKRPVVYLGPSDSIDDSTRCLIVVRSQEREWVGKHIQECLSRNIPVLYCCDKIRHSEGSYGQYNDPRRLCSLLVYTCIDDALRQVEIKLREWSRPLYKMIIDERVEWLGLEQAGIEFDSTWIKVQIGGVVREFGQERPITNEERYEIHDIAEEYSAST